MARKWGSMMTRFLKLTGLAILIAPVLTACSGGTDSESGSSRSRSTPRASVEIKEIPQKIVILGFDGVDPGMTQKWMDEGLLPNLAKLAETGSFKPLRSTIPPQSPVAWSTFATGTNPGQHGIFDFVKRNPAAYLPAVVFGIVDDPEFDEKGNMTRAPFPKKAITGDSFWKTASSDGVRTVALNIPYSFPPDMDCCGKMRSGLGTPCLRGTNSTFIYFDSTLTPQDVKEGAAGGVLVAMEVENGKAETYIEGPKGVEKDSRGYAKRARIPVAFQNAQSGKAIEISVQDNKETVAVGDWSSWMEIQFEITSKYSIHGLCRFRVIEAGSEMKLYLTPLSIHPKNPVTPISYPEEYAGRLMDIAGPYKTVGWVYDTSGLNSEKIDEDVFLEDLWTHLEVKKKMTLRELADPNWNLFISVFTATDRVCHMFYRFIDPNHPLYDAKMADKYGGAILDTYKDMDKTVGQVMEAMPQDALLLIVSDHGFHSYRRGLNTNTWLIQNGYMTLKTGKKFSEKDFMLDVDWTKTKAYAYGTGQIYVNLSGRERDGIVNPGQEYEELVKEIADKLKKVKDPANGEPAISNVYIGKEVFHGSNMHNASDLQLAFREGYRTSWETGLGGIPEELFLDNPRKWSGDHAASDVEDTPGILFSNRPITAESPGIVDIAPTVLNYLEVEVPSRMEGEPIL